MIQKLQNYFEALRYLRVKQIFFRLYFKFFRLPVNKDYLLSLPTVTPKAYISTQTSNLLSFNGKEVSCEFLNDKRIFSFTELPWNSSELPKLWIYQLNYFDYIHALPRPEALKLMKEWIFKNNSGIGLEPYPTSLRIINWIIYLINDDLKDKEITESLKLQFHHLLSKLEHHLLGNHLWENYRACLFMSLFFNNKSLREKYEKKFSREIHQQVLSDGAHAELSPMYQSILVNGLAQLREMYQACKIAPNFPLDETISSMRSNLSVVIHPDGKIAQFNDSAIDFSWPLMPLENVGTMLCSASGQARLEKGKIVVIADAGPVAISYFSGHSHSDNLTFELSFQNERIIVDPGVSTYEISHQRLLERSTETHNTLKVSNLEQSDVWMSFRLGRRATSFPPQLRKTPSMDSLIGGYTYKKNGLKVIHEREWKLTSDRLTINDKIDTSKEDICSISFNFHPNINLIQEDLNTVLLMKQSKVIGIIKSPEALEVKASFYSPNFGQKKDCQKLVLHFKTVGQRVIITNIYFSA
jgi:uncharacterized heparinase superfamily protein